MINPQRESATRRLLRDWKEIQANPLETVYAAPESEGNLFRWFATVLAPDTSKYYGIIMHLEMIFPDNYPIRPPQVNCLTSLHHHHVYGQWICLDILGTHHSPEPYNGWSSSYSILSILLQLQSFLLEEEDTSRYIQQDIVNSLKFSNKKVGHDPSCGLIWPCAPHWDVDVVLGKKKKPIPKVVKKKPKVPVAKKAPTKVETQSEQQEPSTTQPEQQNPSNKPATTDVCTLKQEIPVVPQQSTSGLIKGLTWAEVVSVKNTVAVVVPTASPPVDTVEKQEEKVGKNKRKKLNRLKRIQERLERKSQIGQPSTSSQESFIDKAVVSKEQYKLMQLPNEMLLYIFGFLSVAELKKVERVSNVFRSVAENKLLTIGSELVCFHSKVPYWEDTLGIGLDISINPHTHTISAINTPLDMLSHDVFLKEGVRKSVWGHTFQHWIPVFINKGHGNMKLFEKCVQKVYANTPTKSLPVPDQCLNLMCTLMNTMIVEMMKGISHASIKALYGYCYFHRWLIEIVEQNPTKLRDIQLQVSNFINRESCRTKANCPNIGEFLPLLSVLGPSGLTWDSVKSGVVHETSVRNALWCVKKNPRLARTFPNDSSYRLKDSWEANAVSCKLIMFHVFFLRNVIELEHKGRSLQEIARLYDVNFGCPPKSQVTGKSLEDVLQREIFKIQKVSSFKSYFAYIGVTNLNSDEDIAEYLRGCMRTSEFRGYHGRRY